MGNARKKSIFLWEVFPKKAIWGEITFLAPSFRDFNLETFDNNRYFPPAVCAFIGLSWATLLRFVI